ncbi:NAD-dependent DNA ligase LigA [Dehalococcoides mccartyi]|uniref:DNA ligase n=2 Tax=Dehalococcoides mccartyi TaxID=61435 RepID=DNLJ_DEHMC|nr:NAD-dependent DNA ligase LigA [Dehalococcoides mccartyi]Q3ZX08.1 RecName: Full=DNA ligase; AltName: Full=Polydeoxyribonucleotide synthase [NAD(+)] [Dehalococcoides mccartyi CBDB1]AII60695.1 DNA ligase [Dehalococcoides mccartyi CG5]QBX64638.1 NAD-dependent DNA ligase LigA [Dehalococcoides mccartyi]CAI82759.1 DNA ligase, NAD-dependent [Dehalococcoides mccartyi CBDB1]
MFSPLIEVENLRREINRHNQLYYVQDNPEISDAQYDTLIRRLKELEEAHPELVTPDSPTQKVGAEPLKAFGIVNHPYPLLSLANAFSDTELEAWYQRVKKLLGNISFQIDCEPKMDGLAVALTYRNGKFATGATRGDGFQGENITRNLRTIHSIPLNAEPNAPPVFEVRGEVYLSKNGFAKLNRERADKGLPLFANPRNAAAGSLRQLDPSVTAERPLDIFIYALGYSEDSLLPDSHWQILDYFSKIGFRINPLNRLVNTMEEAKEYYRQMAANRASLPYEADGVVFKVDSVSLQHRLGDVGREPRWAIAYKFPAEQVMTRLKKIGISVGRTGTLNPFAVLEPVNVGGVVVKQAALHNEDDILRKDIREGDTVIIQRAGEVIPEVVAPVLSKRNPESKPFRMEESLFNPNLNRPACPVCGGEIYRPAGEAMHYCTNVSCPAQFERQLEHFVSRGAMDIRGIGESLSVILAQQGLVKNVSDLYYLTTADLLQLPRMGEKSADNIIDAIADSKTRPLDRVIFGLGVRHVGNETATLLSRHYGNIWALAKTGLGELQTIPDIGDKIASSIVAYFSEEKNVAVIRRLEEAGVRLTSDQKPVNKNMPFSGMEFVVTGKLESFSREEAQEKIRSLGGTAKDNVTKATSYLVVGADAGSKLAKARSMGVKELSEREFINMLEQS